jgi:alkanesulfonate monooxygenase SsuD/methylene tetrahydromethanopterin reductase-like flavin-dependent oxidoreductase (luciferase family)
MELKSETQKLAPTPDKIHKITFNGKHHSILAYQQTHPSPLRTPVLFQAGSSKGRKGFEARHAEALFIGEMKT